MLSALPDWFLVILIAMLPWVELRGAIPVGLSVFHMNPYLLFALAVLGNLVPVPLILQFLATAEKLLRRSARCARLLDRIFARTYARAHTKVVAYKTLALVSFVAVPLPFTGAWTGSLIAYLFRMPFSKAFAAIALGVVFAGLLVMVLTLSGWVIFLRVGGVYSL